MIKLLKTNSEHPDFISLVKLLDADLAIRDGADHDFYHQFNGISSLNNTIVAFEDEIPVACGAFKEFDKPSVEIKRMYTLETKRGKGIASMILHELETWAKELGYEKCYLETGIKMPEAIKLYEKSGYSLIPNYGQYIGVETSRCFEKQLI